MRSGICTPLVRSEPFAKVNRCIAEGRKSFLARYADIESGEECERWAPVVSAMIDGEATAEQVLQARPHLRNCSACKALMREADRQRASFAFLFPAAGVAGGAMPATAAGAEPAGLLARVYEAVAGAVHERAVASAVKVQAALDAATAGKVAAVAASAAAVAGGGAVVVDKAVVPDGARAQRAIAHSAPAAATDGARAAAGRKRTATSSDDRPARTAARRRSATAEEFGSSSRETGGASGEFGGGGTSTARAASAATGDRAATPSAPPRIRRPGQVDAEFGP